MSPRVGRPAGGRGRAATSRRRSRPDSGSRTPLRRRRCGARCGPGRGRHVDRVACVPFPEEDGSGGVVPLLGEDGEEEAVGLARARRCRDRERSWRKGGRSPRDGPPLGPPATAPPERISGTGRSGPRAASSGTAEACAASGAVRLGGEEYSGKPRSVAAPRAGVAGARVPDEGFLADEVAGTGLAQRLRSGRRRADEIDRAGDDERDLRGRFSRSEERAAVGEAAQFSPAAAAAKRARRRAREGIWARRRPRSRTPSAPTRRGAASAGDPRNGRARRPRERGAALRAARRSAPRRPRLSTAGSGPAQAPAPRGGSAGRRRRARRRA